MNRLPLFLFPLWLACSSPAAPSPTVDAGPAKACTPGEASVCTCDDGGTGTAVCKDDGSGSSACVCAAPRCFDATLTGDGVLHTSVGDIPFTAAGGGVAAYAPTQHCLTNLTVHLEHQQQACTLDLQFAAVEGAAGGLTQAQLKADAACGSIWGDASLAGTYASVAGYAPWWFEGPTQADSADGGASCLWNTTIRLGDRPLTLARSDGKTITMNLKDLVIGGNLPLVPGSADACVTHDTCASGYHDNGMGWCVQ
jgi:hypothetical protein